MLWRPDAPVRPQPPLRRGHQAARRRPEGRGGARSAARLGEPAGAGARPRAAPADLGRRPLDAREDPRRAAGRDRHAGGPRARAPRPRQEQRPLQGGDRGRDRRLHPRVLPQQRVLGREGPAVGLHPLRVGQAGAVGRTPSDGPPGPGDGRRGLRRHAAGGTRLPADRGAVPPRARQGGGSRAGAPARPAGMAGRAAPHPARLAVVRRRAARRAPADEARRRRRPSPGAAPPRL